MFRLGNIADWWAGGAGELIPPITEQPPEIRTERSATVFSGEPQAWIDYLRLTRQERYEPHLSVSIHWEGPSRHLSFSPDNADCTRMARCLNDATEIMYASARRKPFVWKLIEELVFENRSNALGNLRLRGSKRLPSDAAREIAFDEQFNAMSVDIVLQSQHVDSVLPRYAALPASAPSEEKLGQAWPILFRVIAQLGYPNYPRDRFVEKIDLTAKMAAIAINLLYRGKKAGRLLPNAAGTIYEARVCERDGRSRDELFEQDLWFRLLNSLSFLLDERGMTDYQSVTLTLVREFLDQKYLRLSLAGAMPPVSERMEPMPLRRVSGRLRTRRPEIGRYGIVNGDDLKAWRKVDRPCRKMGYTLLRQLGIGQFGRVYEAYNTANSSMPPHVAVKIDRLDGGRRAEHILDPQTIMHVARDLATAPHLIRVYDAGQVMGTGLKYHVLQLVDGETLDDLIGATGTEHSSIHRPKRVRQSSREVDEEFQESLKASPGEEWRKTHFVASFRRRLTVSQRLDLLTSMLLWLEEIHQRGYVINDLKNGNLMVSRRGLLKGIDLDSYTPIRSTADKSADFCFLAVTLAIYALGSSGHVPKAPVRDQLLKNPADLRAALEATIPAKASAPPSARVSPHEVVNTFAQLVTRSRNGTYAHEPASFTADIDRVIALKRSILVEEIVLD